eukprot:GHVR01003151.1.p2 GENE.GHVR01003151.1~~GHVR01003151.1.p2  ORF type:complete len:156 (-),score=26.62 GHVR01003151.1:843-1310(-)
MSSHEVVVTLKRNGCWRLLRLHPKNVKATKAYKRGDLSVIGAGVEVEGITDEKAVSMGGAVTPKKLTLMPLINPLPSTPVPMYINEAYGDETSIVHNDPNVLHPNEPTCSVPTSVPIETSVPTQTNQTNTLDPHSQTTQVETLPPQVAATSGAFC